VAGGSASSAAVERTAAMATVPDPGGTR